MTTTTAPDGTTIAFTDSGTAGAPVVLVHGITENRAAWDPIAERLGETNRVITMDLRGHGESGTAERYDLETMAGDVVAVIAAAGVERPHLVGHSLGGMVVSAVGAALPVASVLNIDQSLQLGAFKAQVVEFADQLRDPDAFPLVIGAMFDLMAGRLSGSDEFARLTALRRPDQQVVLGVWDVLLTLSEDEIETMVDAALAGYAGVEVPYLTIFGVDPGPGYSSWIAGHIAGAETDVWADHGHYPHLVDPTRFLARLRSHWT